MNRNETLIGFCLTRRVALSHRPDTRTSRSVARHPSIPPRPIVPFPLGGKEPALSLPKGQDGGDRGRKAAPTRTAHATWPARSSGSRSATTCRPLSRANVRSSARSANPYRLPASNYDETPWRRRLAKTVRRPS